MPTFLLDHCVWRPTARALRQAGIQSLTLRALDRAEARNGEVLALAIERRIPLLTRDADFTDLTRYPLGHHWGIIYLRITPPTAGAVHRTLLLALRAIPSAHLRGSLLIVEPDDYRLRRPT